MAGTLMGTDLGDQEFRPMVGTSIRIDPGDQEFRPMAAEMVPTVLQAFDLMISLVFNRNGVEIFPELNDADGDSIILTGLRTQLTCIDDRITFY
nr:hypothetical protein Iba_chr10fCG7450 [Ipomoea batatas]